MSTTRLTPGKRGSIWIDHPSVVEDIHLTAGEGVALMNQLLWYYLEEAPPAARARARGMVGFHYGRLVRIKHKGAA